jgi:ABC-2 type transport system permease protein
MNLRRMSAILVKDLRDATRDGRVVVLLILPIALALFYTSTTPEEGELPEATVAIVDPGRSGVGPELRRAAARSVDVGLRTVPDEAAARRLLDADDADFAVVAGPAPATGPAVATVLAPEDASATTQSVVGLVPDAVGRAAGRDPAARVAVRATAVTDPKPYRVVGDQVLLTVVTLLMLVGFIAMIVVPIQTAEELETGTFGALRLAATGPEVLAAKALAGLLYGVVGIAVTVVLTRIEIASPALFFGGAFALVISLVGFGLLLGLVVANANAINTYGAFLLMPLLGLAVAVFFVDTGILATLLGLLPFSQATRLLGDGLSAEAPFGAGTAAWLVIAVWALAGYGLLARYAGRREL